MKTLFIEARYTKDIKAIEQDIKKLPNKIGLFTTVQFIGSLGKIKAQLEKQGIAVKLFTPKNTCYPGQILGCSIDGFKGVDGFLFVGDGRFHPIALSIKNNLPVFVLDPVSGKISELDRASMDAVLKRHKAALKKFYMSQNIGILVSTKPGQLKLDPALALKKKLKSDGKNAFILAANDISFEQLENFSFIDCFVNTACPRISYDDWSRIRKPVVDISGIMQ